jgi:hypothetical protein
VCFFHFFTGIEPSFHHAPGSDVSDFGTNKGGTFTGFYMLEFDYLKYVTINFDRQTSFEIV